MDRRDFFKAAAGIALMPHQQRIVERLTEADRTIYPRWVNYTATYSHVETAELVRLMRNAISREVNHDV